MAGKLSTLVGGSVAATGAAATAVIVVAGLIGWQMVGQDATSPDTSVPAVAVESADVGVEPAAQAAPDTQVGEGTPADLPEPDTQPPAPPMPAAPPAPTLDVVRVDAAGDAVVAGQSVPESDVFLALDGQEISVARADGGGNFVAMLALGPSDIPRILSFGLRLADGTTVPGNETVVIAPVLAIPANEGTIEIASAPAEAAEDIGDGVPSETTGLPTAADTSDIASVPTDPAPEATTDETPVAPEVPVAEASPQPPSSATPIDPAQSPPPAAPAVLLADDQGVRVVQPGGSIPQAQVLLDAISYDTAGDVILSGRGPADAEVQVYLDNRPLRLADIDAVGNWRMALPQVDPGTYTLRIDQLDASGEVASRVETPFLREEPEVLANLPDSGSGVDVITVQPGFTLWGIARERFGDGVFYVQVYQANRDQIRDPDLIYPGQIFTLPQLAPAED